MSVTSFISTLQVPGTCGASGNCKCTGQTSKSDDEVCAEGGASYDGTNRICRCPDGTTGCGGASNSGCKLYKDISNYWSQKNIYYWPVGGCENCMCEREMSPQEQAYECTAAGATLQGLTTRTSGSDAVTKTQICMVRGGGNIYIYMCMLRRFQGSFSLCCCSV